VAQKHIKIVAKKLQEYADRGVFRSFEAGKTKASKTNFRFNWLEDTLFTLVLDHEKSTLKLKNLLPGIESKSFLDNDLRVFIDGRSTPSLPPHRRIDSKRAELRYSNRKGLVSLILTVHNNQFSYGLTKLLNVTNELFGHLHMNHIQYLYEEFDVPQE